MLYNFSVNPAARHGPCCKCRIISLWTLLPRTVPVRSATMHDLSSILLRRFVTRSGFSRCSGKLFATRLVSESMTEFLVQVSTSLPTQAKVIQYTQEVNLPVCCTLKSHISLKVTLAWGHSLIRSHYLEIILTWSHISAWGNSHVYTWSHSLYFKLSEAVLWIQIHWIWIRIKNFGPIWIRIQGYIINF